MFSIGPVLRASIALWAKNLATITSLFLIVHSPIVLYQLLHPGAPEVPILAYLDPVWQRLAEESESSLAALLLPALLGHLATLVAGILASAATIHCVAQAWRGERVGPLGCLAATFRRIGPVLGAGIAASSLGVAGTLSLRFVGPNIGLLLLLLGATVYIACFVAIPVAMLEPRGPIAALRRSVALGKGCFPLLFVIALLLGILKETLSRLLVPFSYAVRGFGDSRGSDLDFLLVALLGLALTLITGGLGAAVAAVAYRDLRTVHEPGAARATGES